MVAICHAAGLILWGEQLPEGEYAPEYYSLRGEDCPPRLDNNMEEFFSDNEEFGYVYTSAGWTCYNMNQFNDNDPEQVEIPA